MSEVTEGEYFLLTNSEKLLFLKLDLFDLQLSRPQLFYFYLQRSDESVCNINNLVSSSRFFMHSYILYIYYVLDVQTLEKVKVPCKSTLRVTSNRVSFIVARNSCIRWSSTVNT